MYTEGTEIRWKRFQDPDQEQGKAFELHLRKDLPKLVKKCQGQCGKQITDKCFLLVKSFGTIHWTDNSGNSCSRFGPMYIHFDRKCLEQFDTEESYGPSKRFDYSRITVAEKCKQQLKSDEKQFLTNLGIQFWTLLTSLDIFLAYFLRSHLFA